jgi:hypothetical protein
MNKDRRFSIGPSPSDWTFRFTLDDAGGRTQIRFERRFGALSTADRIGDADPFGSKHRKECQELTQATIDRLAAACRRLAESQSDGITPSNLGSEQAAAASPGAADERFEIKEDRLSEKRTQAQLDALRRYEIGLPFTTEQLRDKCRYWLQNVPDDMKEQVRKDYETLLELAS